MERLSLASAFIPRIRLTLKGHCNSESVSFRLQKLLFTNTDVKPYLTTLTPLRGISALLVVVFHSNLTFARMFPPNEAKFISNGWLWVDFFFILSGCILSYVYSESFKDSLNGDILEICRSSFRPYIPVTFYYVKMVSRVCAPGHPFC